MDLKDKLVSINRITKVVKGGRRFAFAALVVVGDQTGSIGVGQGKAKKYGKVRGITENEGKCLNIIGNHWILAEFCKFNGI